jgi:hypothetical protein
MQHLCWYRHCFATCRRISFCSCGSASSRRAHCRTIERESVPVGRIVQSRPANPASSPSPATEVRRANASASAITCRLKDAGRRSNAGRVQCLHTSRTRRSRGWRARDDETGRLAPRAARTARKRCCIWRNKERSAMRVAGSTSRCRPANPGSRFLTSARTVLHISLHQRQRLGALLSRRAGKRRVLAYTLPNAAHLTESCKGRINSEKRSRASVLP